jgi:hypothetical protein
MTPLGRSLSPSPTPLPLCPSPHRSPSACAPAAAAPPLTLSCYPKGSVETAGRHARRDSPPSPLLEGAAAGAPLLSPPPAQQPALRLRFSTGSRPRPRPRPLVSTAGAGPAAPSISPLWRATRWRDVMATAASSEVPRKAERRRRKLEQWPCRPAMERPC